MAKMSCFLEISALLLLSFCFFVHKSLLLQLDSASVCIYLLLLQPAWDISSAIHQVWRIFHIQMSIVEMTKTTKTEAQFHSVSSEYQTAVFLMLQELCTVA